MAEEERGTNAERAPRMRLSPEQRDRFLEVLGQTGNRRAAAEAIGVEPRLMDQRRGFDAVLDRQWREAMAQAERRLAGAEGPFDCIGARAFNVVRKGSKGRTQIVRAGGKRWSKAVEDRFLAALGACGNVAASARAVGFTESSVWKRREKWSDFRGRMEEVLEQAEVRIEFRLATLGNDLDVLEGAEGRDFSSGDTGAEALPETGEFDAEFALRFLKWREEKKRGRVPKGMRGHRVASNEEVREALTKALKAFGGREEARRLAEGWVKDENGHMIPPGWVRAEQSPDAGEAGAGGEAEGPR